MNSARYAPGGDIYAAIESRSGTSWAQRVYAAAQLNQEALQLALNDEHAARRGAEMARPGSDSTIKNFYTQMVTDPLRAPLDGLNRLLGNSVFSVLVNPWVLGAVVCVVVFWLWPKIKKSLA